MLRFRFLSVTTTISIYLLLVATYLTTCQAQQDSENPLEMYGGSVLAMAGKEAVVLVTDRRLGRGLALLHGHSTRPVWNDRQCCSNVGDDGERFTPSLQPCAWLMTATGLPGDVQSLQTDVQAVLQSQHDQIPIALPSSSVARPDISPRAALTLVSHLLYQRRCYLVETLLVGWESAQKKADSNQQTSTLQQPLLCTMDVLGATSICRDYACIGGAASSLWGSAARYWEPRLSTETLVQRAVTAFMAGVDRNILSGYGAVVHVLTADRGWQTRTVTSRND